MTDFLFRPRRIPRTGDDTPAASLFGYVWRMSGRHQVWICLLAVVVAALTAIPLELQRRIVDEVVKERELGLLWLLAGGYLVVLVVQGAAKYALHMYQSWLSESAIRYNRGHLTRLYERRDSGEAEQHSGEAVSIIGAEVDRLGGFVGEGLSQPMVNGGMLVAMGGYMLVVEPLVAAISMAFIVPQIVLMPLLQSRINRLMERRVNRLRTYLWKFGQKAVMNLLSAVAPLSALLVGGIMVIQGETTIGVVVAFISGFERLGTPLRELIAYYRIAAQANVQHKMIARWM
jgi:ABC-type bacteriocin/lantibiotic exporter with double-glycine peptidase domain